MGLHDDACEVDGDEKKMGDAFREPQGIAENG